MSVAEWMLRHFVDEALAGDLLEQVGAGKSQWWLWRQIGVALGVGVWSRKVELAYALGALLLKALFIPLRLWTFGISPGMLAAMVAGTVLLLDRRFGWKGAAKTWLMSCGVSIGLSYALRAAYLSLQPDPSRPVEILLALLWLMAEFSGLYFSAVLSRGLQTREA